ncbi:DNA polymerase IV [Nitrosomonas communis]|uniref:Y-family DNA polymerase n=1 Tax=Nitrosomonas communis TaxID=44574 RepID=UPI0026F111E7|nr:DNA polymerase IV [Nitrosomonas communis]MCO6428337.1 DNA polymerase IV [Nitrosomonas communis]
MNFLSRRIAHVDMDAFFASVELLRYPQLRGLPVVIGGKSDHKPVIEADGSLRFARLRDYVGRGVITSATYEARAAGLSAAMSVMKAAQLAPDTILLPADFDAYRHYSQLFKAAVARITAQIEDSGIDEIYVDLSHLPDDSLTLAKRIKQSVFDATGLTCSIGITPNKLLSKICSDLDKPDGITILDLTDIPERIWPLPVRKINGVGPKTEKKLASLGILTIGELAQAELGFLQTHFGRSYSTWLYEASHGIDHHPVIIHSEPKSISRETTFEHNLHPRHDRAALSEALTTLCTRVANDLQRKGYLGRTIGVKLRFEDFHTVTRDFTLTTFTGDPLSIRQAARECLRRVPLEKKLRLLGIRVSKLAPSHSPQVTHVLAQGQLPLMFQEQ